MFNNWFWWLKQIFPPLLILPLAIIPFDLPTAIPWIISLIACVVSIINVVRMLSRSHHLVQSAYKTLVRPMLTVVFMILAYISIQISLANSTDFARKTAQNIQGRCRTEKACPASIPGWSQRSNAFVSETNAGALAKYRVLYSVSRDRKEFSIFVRYSIDSGHLFTGGVDEELHETGKNG